MPITLFTIIKAASDHLPLPPVVRSTGQYYIAVWGIAKPMVWKAQECVHAAAVRAGMGNFMATLQRPAQRQCCVGAARSSGLEAQVSPWKESFHRTSSPVLAPLSDLCAIEQEDKGGPQTAGESTDGSDIPRHHWEYRKPLLSKSGFWASRKCPWHEFLLALVCSHGSKSSPAAAVCGQRYQQPKRDYCVSRDSTGRSHMCFKRAGKGGRALTRSDSSGDP